MDKARRIHLGLLPAPEITIPGASWAASYTPAELVGGDYHDVVEYADGRRLIVVADVSGHGVSAALVMAMTKAVLRQAGGTEGGLADIVGMLNAELCSLTASEHFVTFLAACYRPSTGELVYVNCGHEPGAVTDSDGRVRQRLDVAGLPLGVAAEAAWTEAGVRLAPGDRLYLWTDGLIELPGPDGEMPGRDHLMAILTDLRASSPQEAVDALIAEARRLCASEDFPDDVTLLTLWRDACPTQNAQIQRPAGT